MLRCHLVPHNFCSSSSTRLSFLSHLRFLYFGQENSKGAGIRTRRISYQQQLPGHKPSVKHLLSQQNNCCCVVQLKKYYSLKQSKEVLERTEKRKKAEGDYYYIMEGIPVVEIDQAPDTFKYILLEFTIKPNVKKPEENKSILLVRGFASCPFHSDIYDLVRDKIATKLGETRFDLKCLGGGRIKHDIKKLHVYGYSQGYGKADHRVTTEILQAVYKDYAVTWSDEGY